MAPGGVVHGDQEAIGAAQEMQPPEIGLQEGCRKLEIDPPCGDRDAPHLEIDGLLVRIAVELGELVAEGAHGPMVHEALQLADLRPRLQVDPVVNEGGRIPAGIPAVQPDGRDPVGQRMRLALPGKGLGNADAIGLAGRLAMGEQGLDLGEQRRRHFLVGIEVQKPVVPALILGEALLQAIARPGIVDDAGAEFLGHT